MKHVLNAIRNSTIIVAPLAGAWIETPERRRWPRSNQVAPLAGAWIETSVATTVAQVMVVAPLAGAWIETTWYKL